MPPKSRRHADLNDPDEPKTVWVTVSQAAIALSVLLFMGGLLAAFHPAWQRYDTVDREGKALEAQLAVLEQTKRDREAEVRRFDEDANFAETRVRDVLRLQRPGEQVFEFEERR